MKKTFLLTGCAGFIGFNLAKKLLLNKKNKIIGIDNINDYYDINLKKNRIIKLKKNINFIFKKIDLSDFHSLEKIIKKYKVKTIFNLAAQAGVSYSIQSPKTYFNSNILGFFNILELSRIHKIKKIFFASSSSVYGDNKQLPVEEEFLLNPKNFYGLSKKSNEEMANIYSVYYGINIIGLRFFTVYGPWGRPDMVILKLIDSFYKKKKFYLNNFGNHSRDFTYIDDVVNIIVKLSTSNKIKNKFEIFNICSSNPITLGYLVKIFKKTVGDFKIYKRQFQSGDIIKTYGSNKKLNKVITGFKFTKLENGFKKTLSWYKNYYKIKNDQK
jgi:UDP-glucuronate 4-epimerase